ncbi:GNAT family protein [Pseudomonas benzenivorans]|uniref:GNAT family protein n=1 Tax=Pseudomonas benzenivorans TaxID=556533 RepID=A0ABZ0PWT6_9PSED|nr:GNAT family protein [Pseudomonas benzenivorans]WPC05216.1 GNAT family protein [Pseudomonas benzenivorans]
MASAPLLHWQPAKAPSRHALSGKRVRLEPLDPGRHGDHLWQALHGPEADPRLWDYMAFGPFASRPAFDAWLQGNQASEDPLYFTVIDLASGRAQGLLSFLNIVPTHGRIEVGNICFGRTLQRSAQATETLHLFAGYAFELGYRRLEWKCDAQNIRSRQAAERFGFAYEGLFRQHMVIKQRNRDTAWYALLDGDWPAIGLACQRWLAPDNFDAEGRQRRRLAELRRRDPAE